jgi:predicted permease
MNVVRILLSRVRGMFGGSTRDRQLTDEISAHLELLTEDHMRCGMTAAEARAAARRDFGGVEQTKERYRDQRGLPWIEDLWRDGRHAMRALAKEPGFAVVVILTLALGIGATTAIFSVVDAVLLRPLAYPDPDRLVVINEATRTLAAFPVNAMHFSWWEGETQSFEQMGLIKEITVNVTGAGEPELLSGARVSPNLFAMLGVRMQLGRGFMTEESQSGRDRVIVLEDALWRAKFGADPNVIGRTIAIDSDTYEIVGVLPRDFRFPALRHLMPVTVPSVRPQLWTPLAFRDAERIPLGAFNFICIAKLKSGVSVAQAGLELEREQATIAARLPQRIDLHASVVPLQTQIVGRSEAGLEMLLAAVGIVLLIGGINITNLLLVRTLGRRREFAVRAAIGADRGRLLRQMLAESFTLCLLGGLAAVGVAYAAMQLIVFAAPDVPRLDEVALDARALAFTLGVSAFIGFVVGVLPAWRSVDVDLTDALARRPGGTTTGRGAGRTRSLLVGAEVGLSAVCLIAGGLLFHSLFNLLTVEKGFDAQNLVTATVRLPAAQYPTIEKRAAFRRALLERVQAIPGVSAVAISNQLPLRGIGATSVLTLEGTTVPPLERPALDVRVVNPEYFRTWGVPLKGGRLFDLADGNRLVALVSEFTARHAWPGADPIGKRIRFGVNLDGPLYEVIGVVGDVRVINLDRAPAFSAYVPYWQRDSVFDSLAIKTATEPAAISSAVRAAIHGLDPDLPVSGIQTMEDVLAESTAQRRFQMSVVLLFAAAALVLAGLGIYGVLSYAVGQRTNEIGIRLALGTDPRAMRGMIVKDALHLVAGGLLVGVPLALVAASSLRALLFAVAPQDLPTVVGVCVVLTAAAWLAAYIPARRASRVDPLIALRCE